MIGQRGTIGIGILAFLGSVAGLSMLGADIGTAIGSGFVIAFFAGVVALFSTVDRKTLSLIPRSQPYQSAMFGTAASEIQELRLGLAAQDVGKMIDDNAKRLRGE